MMFATPFAEYEADPVVARVLDLLLILHADHEQNCSTSAVGSRLPHQIYTGPTRTAYVPLEER